MIVAGHSGLPRGFDRILHVEPGSHASAIQNIPGTLPLFADHFPRFPVLPGLVLFDCMAEAMQLALPGRAKWSVASCRGLSLPYPVVPGDSVEISADIIERTPEGVRGTATAEVAGRTVARVREVVLTPTGSSPNTE